MFLLSGKGTLSTQIFFAIRDAVWSGKLAPGARLPASRNLATELGVSRFVVVLAYQQLAAEGYVEGRVGSGTRVSADLPPLDEPHAFDTVTLRAHRRPGRAPRWSRFGRAVLADRATLRGWWLGSPSAPITFQYGEPDLDGFPWRLWARLTAARQRNPRSLGLGYGDPAGFPELREAIAAHLLRHRAVSCDPSEIVITNGAQHAIDLAARMLLDPGDMVAIEEPHFVGARQAFEIAGARIIPVPVDEQGLDPSGLPPATKRPRLVYVTPSHQFPTGATLSAARRAALLKWAERAGAWIVEDDFDSEFRYEGRPLQALRGLPSSDRVIYVGTFSKTLFPALRLGYLVLPRGMVTGFVSARWLTGRQGPVLEQAVLADFIHGGHFDRHLRRTCRRYSERCHVLCESTAHSLGQRALIAGRGGGMHVVMWLPGVRPRRLRTIARQAEQRGVRVYPLDPFYERPPQRAGLLLGYAALAPETIREGIRRLTEAITS